jgi:hypothetical protein
MTPMTKYLDLARRCDDYALSFDMVKCKDSVKKLEKSLESYTLISETLYRIDETRKDL